MTIIFQSTNCKYTRFNWSIHISFQKIIKVIYNEIFIAVLFSYIYINYHNMLLSVVFKYSIYFIYINTIAIEMIYFFN